MKLTFSPKVRFESLLLFKAFKDFHHMVSFPYSVPVEMMYRCLLHLGTHCVSCGIVLTGEDK